MTIGMTAAVSQRTSASARSRPRCLIVEDEVLIALSIEGYLEDLGYEAEGPFTAGAAALSWLETHTPQAAILDYSLADGACNKLARELRQRGIPFVIYSGYQPNADLPEEVRGMPWLEKPCRREDLLQALRSVLEPGAGDSLSGSGWN